MQYLYENLNSHEEELVELLEVLEGHLKESGYSDKAIECFIETADVHDVESHIQSSSLDEGAKTKLLKKLGTGAWNLIKNQGKRLKDTVKRNTPVNLRTKVKDTVKNTKDSVVKTGNKVKDVIKNNPGKSSIAGAGALTVGALATGGNDEDTEKVETPKVETPKDSDKKMDPNKKTSWQNNVYTPKVETPKADNKQTEPEKPKKNKPDGLARGFTGALDFMTGNMTDFDQRGGKPQGINRALTGFVDATTGNLTDLDKRGGKPWGAARAVTGLADKLTGDRFDFDKRGTSKLNKGQQKIYEPKKDETPKPKVDNNPLSWKNMEKSGILDKPLYPKTSEQEKPPEPPKPSKPSNPSGKTLPTPKEVRPGSARERMISKNIEIHGADKISKLRNKNAAFQATKDKTSGYSKDDFIKDFPNSNTAKKYREKNRIKHPDLNKVLGRKESYDPSLKEEFDAFDIVLSYLGETQQVESLDEALYIMMEMDEATIQGIVRDFELITEEAYDRQKDAQAERGAPGPGDGDNPSTRKPNYGRKQTDAEKKKSQENSKKAFNTVVDRLRSKYGNNAIVTNSHLKKAKKKKEEAQNK